MNDAMLLPVTEAVRRLGIGQTKFWSLVKSGDLRVKRIGRRTLIEAAEIIRFVEALPGQQNGSTAR